MTSSFHEYNGNYQVNNLSMVATLVSLNYNINTSYNNNRKLMRKINVNCLSKIFITGHFVCMSFRIKHFV